VIALWDLVTLWCLRTLKFGEDITSTSLAVAFSPDGKTLVASNDDGMAYAWDLKAGKLAAVYDSKGTDADWVGFSPDGKRLAVCGTIVVLFHV
jgi:WD40 repeat protein